MTDTPACPAMMETEAERPGDFSAVFARAPGRSGGVLGGHRSLLHRRWSLGAAALAVVALPAFAAQGTWDRFTIADAVEQDAAVKPMPFEQAGDSFPGSAFYYLQLDAPVPQVGEGIHSDAEDAPLDPAASPVARAMRVDNSGVDRTRAEQCLTAAIYYEAASEPDSGQRAVAQVVLNRVAHPAYPKTVCGVVYQGSERATGCQFSFTCDGSLARRPVAMFWDRARAVARAALSGYVYAPVGLATHYHTVQVHPYWAASLDYLGTIGAHRFYAFQGAAGRPATFRFAYMGGEPLPAPNPRNAVDASLSARLDPVAIERAYAEAAQNARAAWGGALTTPSANAAPAFAQPRYSDEVKARGGETLYQARNLPETQGIKPEYANSGRWLTPQTDQGGPQ